MSAGGFAAFTNSRMFCGHVTRPASMSWARVNPVQFLNSRVFCAVVLMVLKVGEGFGPSPDWARRL